MWKLPCGDRLDQEVDTFLKSAHTSFRLHLCGTSHHVLNQDAYWQMPLQKVYMMHLWEMYDFLTMWH